MARTDRVAELKELVELNYYCTAEHIRSAVVREHLGWGKIWEGIVEVFAIRGCYPVAHCYAWLEDAASCTILELGPVKSPQTAVQSAFRPPTPGAALARAVAEPPVARSGLVDVAVIGKQTFAFHCETLAAGTLPV
jgi:hypothetical protein